MMTKEINQSWDEFLETLGPQDDSVLKQIKCPLLEMFDKQVYFDKIKKAMFKPEQNKLLKLYLSRIELKDLDAKINLHRKNFVRGFGQDRFNHLKLLVRLKIIDQERKPKKGLLAV